MLIDGVNDGYYMNLQSACRGYWTIGVCWATRSGIWTCRTLH